MLPQHLDIDIVYGPISGVALFTNRLYYDRESGTVTAENIDLIADHFKTQFASTLADCMTDAYQVYGCNAHWIGSDNDYAASSSGAAVVGTLSSEGGGTLPEHASVVMRRKTGFTGRDKRGRIFVCAVPESFQESGRLNETGITAYSFLAAKLDSTQTVAAAGVTFKPVQPSFKTNSLIEVTGSELVIDVLTRRDRALPKKPLVQGVIGV